MQKEAAAYYFNKLQAFSDADHRAFDRPYIDHATVKRVHIVGVCGTAMGSLAGLFVEKGFMISGSDTACYPPMSDMIESLGITFYEGYREENCKDADVIVMGNAIGPANPEAAYARNNNIPTLSLPEALHIFFTSHRTCLVVAGTHGKTTTTGLLIHILRTAGYDPGFMVGGVLIEDEKSFSVGKDPFFILEGDEYDTAYFDKSPKFLHYHPDSAIVTSVEFDHVDIYKDAQEYDQAFSFLSKEVRENLIVCGDDQHVLDCVQNTTATLMSYGLTAGKDISCTNIQKEREGTAFTLIFKGQEYEDMFVSLVGEHNLLNTLAVCGLALSEGVGIESLHEGLKSFKGMKRRQEVIGVYKDITIIDDFAHHPTAVRETIKAIKQKYPTGRIVVVFEPRSNTSRRKLFEELYTQAFDAADFLYLKVPPLRHNDDPKDFMDARKVVEGINERGTVAVLYESADGIVADVIKELQAGDVLLIMSNGSFDGIHQKLIDKLEGF